MTGIIEIESVSLHAHEVGTSPAIGKIPPPTLNGQAWDRPMLQQTPASSRWASFKETPSASLSKAFETLGDTFTKDALPATSQSPIAQKATPSVIAPPETTTAPVVPMATPTVTVSPETTTAPVVPMATSSVIAPPETTTAPVAPMATPTMTVSPEATTAPVAPMATPTMEQSPINVESSQAPVRGERPLEHSHEPVLDKAVATTPSVGLETPSAKSPTNALSEEPVESLPLPSPQRGVVVDPSIPQSVEKPASATGVRPSVLETPVVKASATPEMPTAPTLPVETPASIMPQATTPVVPQPSTPVDSKQPSSVLPEVLPEGTMSPSSTTEKPTLVAPFPSTIVKGEVPQSQVSPKDLRPVVSQDELTTIEEVVAEVKTPIAPTPMMGVVSPATLIEASAAPLVEKQTTPSPQAKMIVAAVEAVTKAIAVSSTLATTGEGEIRIQLKQDVLDGSSIRLEVKGADLKIVITPASRAAEETFVKHQEAFQMHLAERVTNWRINVGVSQWSARSIGNAKLEEEV